MACTFSVLISIVLTFLMVNAAHSHSHNCSLADHIRRHKTWKIEPPQNIYGNETIGKSMAWTWTVSNNIDIEEEINKQINKELHAHYTYLSMAAHFDRDDIKLPGFARFFKESAEEERKHAQMFMEYLNRRGGRVKLHSILHPCQNQWGNGRTAMEKALILEKDINRSLNDLHAAAETLKDYQMTDFIESNFLSEQIESIKTLADYVNTLTRIGDGLGEYQFDQLTLGKKGDQ